MMSRNFRLGEFFCRQPPKNFMEIASGATCFFLTVFACRGRRGAQNSPSGCPCHGQEKAKVQLGQCPALVGVYHSK